MRFSVAATIQIKHRIDVVGCHEQGLAQVFDGGLRTPLIIHHGQSQDPVPLAGAFHVAVVNLKKFFARGGGRA